ncbi:MAG: ImmA/IrrE family metallo-endopeptidase, partial [bacterium]
RDFRSRNKNIYSTALVFMMREVQEKQAWLKELYQTENEQSLKFIGKFNQTVSSKIIAEDIRKTLRINSKEAQKDPLKYWIEKSENNRIFISQSSFYHTRLKLDVEEVKGFAIADSLVPFIFINSSDYKSSRLFTLVHELAHLWIKASGISSDIGIDFRDVSTYDPIEIFCNDIAACALMPENEMYEIVNASEDITYSIIEEVSLRFGVSNYAAIMRFLKLGKISIQQFEIFKKEASSKYFQYLELDAEKIKTGFPNPYLLKLKRNGKMFAQIIFNFYKGGRISGSEASTLLNTKINHFPKFEQYVY